MTIIQHLNALKDRLSRVKNRKDAYKCPGCIRKIERQIRNLEKKVG